MKLDDAAEISEKNEEREVRPVVPGRVGVIVANTGSPDDPSPEAVARYLRQFLMCPRICPMNPTLWQFLLDHVILRARSKKSAAKYATIWGEEGFQFIRDHERICEKLNARYNELGCDVVALPAMSFGNPSVESAMKELAEKGCERLVVLPLYPQNAFSQASIVADDVQAHALQTGWDKRYVVVGDYSDNERYLKAIAQSITQAGFDAASGDVLVMSFHSIPIADVEQGDTYPVTTEATCERVAELLGLTQDQWRRCYQSRFDKERSWVSPFTKDVLNELAPNVSGRLFFVCPNFSVDCLETYYDIGRELEPYWYDALEQAQRPRDASPFVYVPCLGPSGAHVEVIMDVLAPHLGR